MPDASYGPKVYRKQGGDEIVIASGGKITKEPGSSTVMPFVSKAVNYTVLASESGTTFEAAAVDLVFTLPSTAAGLMYTFVVKTLSTTTGLQISPAAADKIMGNGFTSADNKDAINTAATDREGDMISLIGDGVDGWYVTGVIGTWAREA